MRVQEFRATVDSHLSRLYERPLPAARTGPLYNAVSYPTKISAESVGLFIGCHTRPGDTVLDAFAGSGSAGLGALLCDSPTERMRQLAADLGAQPAWGPREAVLYELSEFGSLIARVMCAPPDPSAFIRAAATLIDDATERLGWAYATQGPDGEEGFIRHTIWTEVLECGACGGETSYWTACVRRQPLRLEKSFVCGTCGLQQPVDACARATEHRFDPLLGRSISRRRRVPAWVYGQSGTKRWSRPGTPADGELEQRVEAEATPPTAPVVALRWGDLYRAGYHFGMSHLHHLYTGRNFAVMASLWHYVEHADGNLRDALRLLLLSYNASHATLMTRVVVKDGTKDFALTGSQSGVLYVPALPVEKNLLPGLRRKAKTLADAFAVVERSRSTVQVVTGSSTSIDRPSGSVDYVFTDPPFGANIPYSEVNQVNELWLGAPTDQRSEVIVSASQGKDVARYRALLTNVFREVARVMRPGAPATVVFHSAHPDVWGALSDALAASDLGVVLTNVLDKTQPSFKQTVASAAVKGDALILVGRGDDAGRRALDPDTILVDLIAQAVVGSDPVERTPERLYSRFVGECLRHRLPVPWSAADFYVRVTGRQTA